MATDTFSSNGSGLIGPAENAVAITPDDSNDLATMSRALFIGGAGNLVVVMKGGQTVTFYNLAAGSILSIRAARVKASSTTATNIINLY